MKADVKMNEV